MFPLWFDCSRYSSTQLWAHETSKVKHLDFQSIIELSGFISIYLIHLCNYTKPSCACVLEYINTLSYHFSLSNWTSNISSTSKKLQDVNIWGPFSVVGNHLIWFLQTQTLKRGWYLITFDGVYWLCMSRKLIVFPLRKSYIQLGLRSLV